jgi:hypothetical protein
VAGSPAEDDGISVTDTATGRSRLLVSLARIVSDTGITCPDDPPGTYYAFHVKWNPRGDRLMLVLRCVSAAGEVTSTLVTLNADGTEVGAALSWKSNAGNHPNWCPDGDTIIMNLRVDGGRMKFVTFGREGNDIRVLSEHSEGSGHPTMHPSGKILTDAYPWEVTGVKDGTVPLRWIDPAEDAEEVLAWIPATAGPPRMRALRLDLHPAWDRGFGAVAFNGYVDGQRRVFVADMSEQLARSR